MDTQDTSLLQSDIRELERDLEAAAQSEMMLLESLLGKTLDASSFRERIQGAPMPLWNRYSFCCRVSRALNGIVRADELSDFLSDTAPERLSFGSKESSVPRIYPDPLKEVAAPVADQPYDYYAVTDFEATCWPGHCTAELQEIIELPVVLIEASSGKVVGEFQSFVRPVARPKLSSFCTRLTGITQANVDSAPTFPEAARQLMKWLEEKAPGGSIAWVADGDWDFDKMLFRHWQSCDASLHRVREFAPAAFAQGCTTPRMYIKQVIIRGFKTYKDADFRTSKQSERHAMHRATRSMQISSLLAAFAVSLGRFEEQTTLDEDFSPGTNVVVGFNGSGKSNFFQAILFVLSDQYSSLRAETRKALLHEGAGQAVLTAYVEVVLDNADRRIPVESDTLSIRRLIGVKKDDWLLDGKHATKAEIFGLLEGAGFAKTSPYYIVQQGKVSELTMMTDAQRLGLLKDISGAGLYDERRTESVKIMEDTAARRTQTEGLIQDIEQKLQSLEEEQRELREYSFQNDDLVKESPL
eukprot:g9808.t1